MLWKESTTSIVETYFWIKNTTKGFLLKTFENEKQMKDLIKEQLSKH